MTDHDYRAIDAVLSSRIRLAAMAVLASADSADFSFLLQQTGATAGNLGAHMKKLRDCGYVAEKKRFFGDKPNTAYSLTRRGRKALENHLSYLEQMIGKEGGE